MQQAASGDFGEHSAKEAAQGAEGLRPTEACASKDQASQEQWIKAQQQGAKCVLEVDNIQAEDIKHVVGVDIEWVTDSVGMCVAALLPFPPNDSSQPQYFVHQHSTEIPYQAGFLGFREVDAYVEVLKRIRTKFDCVLVDGNGLLHPRRFGSACQLGISTGLCTIGMAKHLHFCCGKWTEKMVKAHMLSEGLLDLDLADSEGSILGRAMRHTSESRAPIYVSVGHWISLDTACNIVRQCMLFRIPEPIRLADIRAGQIGASMQCQNSRP